MDSPPVFENIGSNMDLLLFTFMEGVSLTALRRGPVTMLTKKQVQEIDSVFKMAH